jgi:hypothetical protein
VVDIWVSGLCLSSVCEDFVAFDVHSFSAGNKAFWLSGAERPPPLSKTTRPFVTSLTSFPSSGRKSLSLGICAEY